MTSTIFTVGFCVCGALFSIFKYYKTPKHSFFLYFSIVCVLMCFRILTLAKIAIPYIYFFEKSIAGLLIISFYVFIYFFLENSSQFFKNALIFGGLFFSLYIIINLFGFEKLISITRYLGKYVDTLLVVIIGISIFRKKQRYMRFIQVGMLLLFSIALLVYIPRIIGFSFEIPQNKLVEIEAILGVCLFQFSMVVKEKELALKHDIKLLKNQQLKKKIELLEKELSFTHQKLPHPNKEYLLLKNNIKIKLEDLMYIHSDGHYLELYTKNKKMFVREKISVIAQKLPENFLLIHRSYIINMNYIQRVFSNFVLLTNKTEVPLARSKKELLKTKLLKFKREHN